jgi:ABC-2 type transport system permease protein
MKLIAFLKRDFLIALSYRFRIILRFGTLLLYLFMFYFIGKTFSGIISPHLQRYGGNYFHYVLVGIAVSSFVMVGLNTLSKQIRSAQVEGTLEALLATPTSIYTVLIGNSLYTFLTAMISGLLLLFGGAIFLDMHVNPVQIPAILLVLGLTFLAFLNIGMLSASFIMIFKEGNPIGFLFGTLGYFIGGVVFPVEVLPRPVQYIAKILPITHAVRALRELLLAHMQFQDVVPLITNLLIFIAATGPTSALFFRYAVKKAKINGSLIQY